MPDYQLLAKQPIYDSDRSCRAYELLFRSPMDLTVKDVGAELATNQVLANYCSCISTETEAVDVPVFINVDRAFVLNSEALPVDASKVVLELSEPGSADPEILDALKRWRGNGFKVALSGYNFSSSMSDFLGFIDFAKVNMLSLSLEDVEQAMGARRNSGITWVAERIEDQEIFSRCVSFGFDWFQGYFLAEPEGVLGSAVRPSTSVTVRVIKALDQPDISITQITELVSQDPKLAVQMLKIINSSLFSLPKAVVDLKQAIVYLGVDMLRHWAMILAFLSNGNLHIEVCRMVLLRAKACELLCIEDSSKAELGPMAFLVGLVSGVDLLLHVPHELFLEQVEMADDVRLAVLEKKGEIGPVLKNVMNLEYNITQSPQELAEMREEALAAYRAADAWVAQVVAVLRS